MIFLRIHCAIMNVWASCQALGVLPAALFYQGNETIQARKNLLLEQRAQIAARIDGLQAVLARLDWKLDGYEERMVKCEENLR